MAKDTVATPARSRAVRPPRAVLAGDVPPKTDRRSLERDRIARASLRSDVVSAQALSDMLALVDGLAPDERKRLRRTLFEREVVPADGDPDLELVPGWRDGAYPYKNLMARRSYERQKYRLQVELLKLHAWVKDTCQRVVILFE